MLWKRVPSSPSWFLCVTLRGLSIIARKQRVGGVCVGDGDRVSERAREAGSV